MITTASDWTAANALLGKTPIYVFTIEGQTTVYCTQDLVKMGITGTLPTYKPWLLTPQGSTQTIDVINGTSSIGELTCEVLDLDGSVLTLIGGGALEGSTITLTVGYPGIAYSSFVILHTYQIYKIIPSAYYTSWLFVSQDNQMVGKQTLYFNPLNGIAIDENNVWVLQGTPSEIIIQIYMWGLGQPASLVDYVGLMALDAAAEGLYGPCRPFQFMIDQPFEAKQFLETEVYKTCGMYPVVLNTGQISARVCRAPATGPVPVFTFNNTNVIGLPTWDRMQLYNEIIYDIDEATDGSGSYATELVYIEGSSVSLYGSAGQLTLQSAGLRTLFGAQWFCEDVSARMFARFAGAPDIVGGIKGGAPVLTVNAFFLTLPVWVGDYVALDFPLSPNPLTGTMGISGRIYEVIDRNPNYTSGQMSYTLLDTGLTGMDAAQSLGSAIIGSAEVF
jgi:hypothetical protein